jgi:hypothetical protein
MTCFFDPSHGPGGMTVMWSPQWGVPRPVQTCVACGQRVQSAPPPYYVPQGAQAGYPQAPGYAAPAPGYPAQGYPEPGYAQPGYPQQPRRGHSTGAVVGAGVAGLVGGALIGEMMADEERPEIIENNTYVDERNDYNGDFNGGYDNDNGNDFF